MAAHFQKVTETGPSTIPVVCNRAPFPRTQGTAETLIFWPAANPTYYRHMQGQLTDKTMDVYTAFCCFT